METLTIRFACMQGRTKERPAEAFAACKISRKDDELGCGVEADEIDDLQRDVVKITTFVVGYQPQHRAVIGAARTPFFEAGKPPASTLVGVAALALPDWLVEIEAVAIID